MTTHRLWGRIGHCSLKQIGEEATKVRKWHYYDVSWRHYLHEHISWHPCTGSERNPVYRYIPWRYLIVSKSFLLVRRFRCEEVWERLVVTLTDKWIGSGRHLSQPQRYSSHPFLSWSDNIESRGTYITRTRH